MSTVDSIFNGNFFVVVFFESTLPLPTDTVDQLAKAYVRQANVQGTNPNECQIFLFAPLRFFVYTALAKRLKV